MLMKGVVSSLFLSFLHWKLCRITYLETSIHISLSGNWCAFICVCAEWSVEGRGPCLEEPLSFWGWGLGGGAADLGLCNVGTHRRQCLWPRGASPAGGRAGFGAGLGKNDSSFNPEAGRMIHRARRTFLIVRKVSGRHPDREKKNETRGDQSW